MTIKNEKINRRKWSVYEMNGKCKTGPLCLKFFIIWKKYNPILENWKMKLQKIK